MRPLDDATGSSDAAMWRNHASGACSSDERQTNRRHHRRGGKRVEKSEAIMRVQSD
jgi:hypothetical protein